MIKALIFDFDGLILDTETPDFQTWAEIFATHGVELPLEEWIHNIGGHGFNPYQMLEDRIGSEVDRTQMRDQRYKRYQELCERKAILPGVERMIQQAKDRDLRLAVASNSFGKWVNSHLQRLGLYDYFDSIITLDQITIGKPEPKMYLTTVASLGVRPDQAIAFEDSPTGAMGAKRAGIYTVAVPNKLTRDLDFSHCDLVVASLGLLDLDKLIETVSETIRSCE